LFCVWIAKHINNLVVFSSNMELVFLGTSCMVPTKERNHQSIYLKYREEGLLFDCGEGTQRQLKMAGIKPSKITKIFITHWHGDHVLGLPGLLQTLNASEYENKLEIYGPKGTKKRLVSLFSAFSFALNFDYEIKEINKNSKFEFKEFIIESKKLDHVIPCFGFAFIEKDRRKIKTNVVKKLGIPEGPLLGKLQNNKPITWKSKKITPKETTYLVKGKKIAFIFDTVPCKSAYALASGADLLVAESVYGSEHEEKAREYKHMTAGQAAQIAAQSNVIRLILSHFSQRYKTTDKIIEDASIIFKEVSAAHDLMKIKI